MRTKTLALGAVAAAYLGGFGLMVASSWAPAPHAGLLYLAGFAACAAGCIATIKIN